LALHDLSPLVEKAKELGAIDVAFLPASEIVVAHWVRLKCMFGCPDYGKFKTCPHYTPDAEEMKKVLSEYNQAMLIKAESHDHATQIVVKLLGWLYSQGEFKAFPLGSGRCRLCEECDIENCRFPHQAYPSMEACSIDVFETIRRVGWSREEISSKGRLFHYGAVLLW
jgi:predicted metal-binding protein